MELSQPAGAPPRLTPREREIVQFVGRGLDNREIAAALGLRPGTVNTAISRVYEQLGMNRPGGGGVPRVKLALYALGLAPG